MKLEHKICLFFGTIFLLFAFSFILLNFAFSFILLNFAFIDIFDVVGIILAFVFLITQKKWSSKITYSLIFLSLVFRVLLLFLPYHEPVSDYAFFYNNSIAYSQGLEINNAYVSLFPYLYFYVFLLGNVMKILNTSYKVVILVNLFFELVGAFLFYLIAKENNKNVGKAMALYLCNPISFLWIVKCCPVCVFNAFLLLVLYLFYKLMNTKKPILLSVLLGIVMSITNQFRPLIIIFVLTILLVYGIAFVLKKKSGKTLIISLFCILLPYFLLNFTFGKWISKRIGYPIPNNPSGWSMYTGANYEFNGRWNEGDSIHFFEVIQNTDNVTAHQIMQEEAIARYKNLKWRSIILLIKKAVVLGGAVPSYTYSETILLVNLKIPFTKVIKTYIYTYMFLLLMMQLYIGYKSWKLKKIELLDYVSIIFIMGLFSSSLLVEVSERYFLPFLIPILIYDLNFFENNEKK